MTKENTVWTRNKSLLNSPMISRVTIPNVTAEGGLRNSFLVP